MRCFCRCATPTFAPATASVCCDDDADGANHDDDDDHHQHVISVILGQPFLALYPGHSISPVKSAGSPVVQKRKVPNEDPRFTFYMFIYHDSPILYIYPNLYLNI